MQKKPRHFYEKNYFLANCDPRAYNVDTDFTIYYHHFNND